MSFFDMAMPALAAYSQGQQINANLDATQADTALKTQALAQQKQNMQLQQQQMQQRQQAQQALATMMQGWAQKDQQDQATRVANGQAPDLDLEHQYTQQADRYRQMGQSLLPTDPTMAESYLKLADAADGKLTTVRTNNMAVAKDRAQKVASYAGAVLNGDVSPQDAFQWVKDNVGMQEAMQMPTDPQAFKNYWHGKQMQGLTAQQQIEAAQSAQDSKDKAEAADQAHQDRQDAIAQRRSDAAALREVTKSRITAQADAAAARAEDHKQAQNFQQSTKLNTNLQRQAKPYLDDLQRLDDVEGLLNTNSSAADQQIHQSLVALLGNFKGRATSQFYKDNRNFGSLANHFTGFLSHNFTGRYQDSDRQEIKQLVQSMREGVVAPALNSMEQGQKRQAQAYGLDPDNIEINADFTRVAPASRTPTPTPSPTPGAGGSGAGKPQFQEGQTAIGPNNHRIVFRNGKWVDA